MKRFIFHTLAGLLAVGLFGANFAQAQAGSPDPTFDKGGIVTANLGLTATAFTAIEQSNGDIAVVAAINHTRSPQVQDFALLRFASRGKLIGTSTASFFTNGYNNPTAAAVQSNGDIVVAGTAAAVINEAQEFALARLTPTGELDPTFGNGGLVTTVFSNPCCDTAFMTLSSLLVQPDSKILVAGVAPPSFKKGPGMTVLARYNTDGSLDETFGTGGTVMVVPALIGPLALEQLADGSYLAIGGPGSVVEFSPTGVLQSTVTPGTVVAASLYSATCCTPIISQPNGDYLFAQTVGNGFQKTAGEVSRFDETGVVDSSFSSMKFTFGNQQRNEPATMALQSNGQIVVGGASGLARLNSDGELDPTFGSSGSLATFGVTGVLIQKNGRIVAVGDQTNNQTGITTLMLARYLAK